MTDFAAEKLPYSPESYLGRIQDPDFYAAEAAAYEAARDKSREPYTYPSAPGHAAVLAALAYSTENASPSLLELKESVLSNFEAVVGYTVTVNREPDDIDE